MKKLKTILAEHAAMRDRLEELEELCKSSDDEPLRWSASGEKVAKGFAVRGAPDINEALHSATSAIYFADNSDYLTALWSVVVSLDPKIGKLLRRNESEAYRETARRVGLPEN
jgi:hypothetical protein